MCSACCVHECYLDSGMNLYCKSSRGIGTVEPYKDSTRGGGCYKAPT